MVECPSCQQALPPHAHFCARCGMSLSVIMSKVASGTSSAEPYAHKKQQLAAQSAGIMDAMTALLPFVYEDRRAENQALFASTLVRQLPLEDPIWGRVAFVMGAYGNYMHRYPLSLAQKQQVWQAVLWAVFYERCFRRKYLTQRVQQLLHFLHGCAQDPTFLSSALDDLEALRPYLEISSLKKVVASLTRLPEPPVDLQQRLNAQLDVALASVVPPTTQHSTPTAREPDQSASFPAKLSSQLESQPAQTEDDPASTLIQSMQRRTHKRGMGGHNTDSQQENMTVHALPLQALHAEATLASSGGARVPSVVERAIVGGARVPLELGPDADDSPVANASENVPRSALPGGSGLAEDRSSLESGTAHILRLFLNEEQCREFLVSLRTARLEALSQLLRGMRRELFSVLLHALEMDVSMCQEPRRFIRLGRKNADRFNEARQLLESTRANEQQRGLRLFEQGARETTHPDYTSLAREWMLYARARVQGSPRVIDDWEHAHQRNEASWEERWNLAAFYQQTGYPAESLRVLRPEIEAWRAPVAHLRLALTSALCLLLKYEDQGDGESRRRAPALPARDEEASSRDAEQEMRAFLLIHLERWPHPLCYLAWLVLVEETHGPLHPRQQSQRLSAFQELAEQVQPLPDPCQECSASRLAELEELLVHKARCAEAWFCWINDYATRHPRNYTAWTQLAEVCERLGHLGSTEEALQHLVEIQYHHDYAHYEEGTPLPRARFLRRNLERLFEFYQRHRWLEQGAEAFTSCYPILSHLWDTRDPDNRKLLALTQPYLEDRQRAEERAAQSRLEQGTRGISRAHTLPLELGKVDQRVGMFIDYENIARFIPRAADIEEVGRILADHAASFGTVVCQWASASPQNLSNLADVRGGLEAAGFRVRLPRRELQFSPSKKNLADFALLECLSEAAASERPDIYLIVSGDRDYYERICSLLDAGHTVRLLASTESQHLSLRYRELEQQRERASRENGRCTRGFFIDDLEEVLCPLVAPG